jgi:transposase-like protein
MPFSVTTDGSPAVIKALQQVWPRARLQRCLVHIQRQGLMWCRRYPSRQEAKYLRRLFLIVPTIKTTKQRDDFIADVLSWEQRYGAMLQNSPSKGWVFSDLQRARSMLLKALPNMFHYLDHPSIPNSTNLVEGYFSLMKNRYRNHRGLPAVLHHAYFTWYFFLKR